MCSVLHFELKRYTTTVGYVESKLLEGGIPKQSSLPIFFVFLGDHFGQQASNQTKIQMFSANF